MRRWHRLCALLTVPVMLYIVATGAGIEFADMAALLGRAPETGPEMRTMRAHVYGPPSFVVVSATDYAAPALPPGIDFAAALERTAELARAAVPGGSLRLVEMRTWQGRPVGHARMNGTELAFDLQSGARLPDAALPWPQPPPELSSPRATFKNLHRLGLFGMYSAGINLIAGIALSLMIITGLIQYQRLFAARASAGRAAPLWGGSGWLRTLHRSLSLIAVVPVLWLLLSGLALSLDNFIPAVQGALAGPPKGPDAFMGDFSKPMDDAELPAMAGTTLASFAREHPGTGIKVLRLRYFAGYPQGVIVAADSATSQLIYDTRTGAPLSMDEPGYPKLFFPEGWELHQDLKRMHRGDLLGMPGRWIASLAALSLLYLLTSGIVMYWQQWRRRVSSGRSGLIWK